jgi:hypothetical protein
VPPDPVETQPEPGEGSETIVEPAEAQPADAESASDLSQEVDKSDWDKIPEDAREHVLEMAKELAEGKTTLGQLKRGHRLVEDMEKLRDEIRGLREEKDKPATKTATAATPLADIKDEAALEEIVSDANKFLRWARRNPDGGIWDGKELDRDALNNRIDLAETARDEWVPKRAKEIARNNQFMAFQQQQIQSARNDYPWLKDPENAETAAARNLLRDVPMLNQTDSPEYWAAVMVKGQKAMVADKEARLKPAATPAQPAAVPRARPVSSPATAAPKASIAKQVTEARQLLGKDRSRNAFANLISVIDR